MATWARWSLGGSGRAELAKNEAAFLVDPLTGTGKVIGILAILALFGFLATAWGESTGAPWWPQTLAPTPTRR